MLLVEVIPACSPIAGREWGVCQGVNIIFSNMAQKDRQQQELCQRTHSWTHIFTATATYKVSKWHNQFDVAWHPTGMNGMCAHIKETSRCHFRSFHMLISVSPQFYVKGWVHISLSDLSSRHSLNICREHWLLLPNKTDSYGHYTIFQQYTFIQKVLGRFKGKFALSWKLSHNAKNK